MAALAGMEFGIAPWDIPVSCCISFRLVPEFDLHLIVHNLADVNRHAGAGWALYYPAILKGKSRGVAQVYREEIAKRTRDFSVIAFAVFSAGYGPNNYIPFAEAFPGE